MENSEQMLEISNKSENIPENSEIKAKKRKSLVKLQRLSLNKNLLQRRKVEADLKEVET